MSGAFTGVDAPDLEAIRKCVHCGICLPQCPTYRVLGEETESPRGRIYLMRAAAEGRVPLTGAFARHFDLCLGCRACETACPSGVPFGELLESTRAELARQGRPPHGGRLARVIQSVFSDPARLGAVMGPARLYQRSGLQRLVRRSGLLRAMPRLAAMEAVLPTIPARVAIPALTPPRGARRGRVGLLLGCVQRHVYPHVNRDTVRLLAAAGYEVVVPRAQGCCGALALHGGQVDEFRRQANALATVFGSDVDFVVTNAAGCGSALKSYGHWLPDSPVARAIGERARDVSEVLAAADLPLGRLDATVTYHDACHLAHGQRIRTQPRDLLRSIPGIRLVEMAESDMCCGSAGVYNLLEPAMADALLTRKVERVVASGASIVASGNPGCLLQIARGLRERDVAMEVVHPVELLARVLEDGASR